MPCRVLRPADDSAQAEGASACPEDGVGAGELNHAGVVQHEFFEVDERALAPQCGSGIENGR